MTCFDIFVMQCDEAINSFWSNLYRELKSKYGIMRCFILRINNNWVCNKRKKMVMFKLCWQQRIQHGQKLEVKKCSFGES
jgi:hypothetical protein